MSDEISRTELEKLIAVSDEMLSGELWKSLERSAIECLDQALIKRGGKKLVFDDTHNMDCFIEREKLNDVLNHARRLAKERGIAPLQTTEADSVVTNKDAVWFIIMGGMSK